MPARRYFAASLCWLLAVAAVRADMPSDSAASNEQPEVGREHDLTAAIDHFIEERWRQRGVEPAARSADATFVRRVYLDLAGRVPTVAEVERFLDDDSSDKRAGLVDVLLESQDYAVHMADVFDALLMGRGGSRDYRQREENHWRDYLQRVFAENRPWNEVAREILLARPRGDDDRGSVWFLFERKNKHQEIAEAVAPAFFGLRIECAQCHDHPSAYEIEQRHYWGLVAFFRRGKNTGSRGGPRIAESAVGGFEQFADLSGDSFPNLLSFVDTATVDEPRPDGDAEQADSDDLYAPSDRDDEPRVPKFSRRQAFVDDVLADHPRLARAMVNRTWALLMGRGIVHPFDEMDSEHPASHPELLDHLSDDFRQSGYDVKRLLRAIARSKAYQLSACQPAGAGDPADFAWYLERGLTAEQYVRSIQLVVRSDAQPEKDLLTLFRDRFPDVLPDENVTPLKQVLFLSNNAELNGFLEASRSAEHLVPTLAALDSNEARVDALFRRAFSRPPDAEERAAAVAFLARRGHRPEAALNELVWAAVTSAEFRFNH